MPSQGLHRSTSCQLQGICRPKSCELDAFRHPDSFPFTPQLREGARRELTNPQKIPGADTPPEGTRRQTKPQTAPRDHVAGKKTEGRMEWTRVHGRSIDTPRAGVCIAKGRGPAIASYDGQFCFSNSHRSLRGPGSPQTPHRNAMNMILSPGNCDPKPAQHQMHQHCFIELATKNTVHKNPQNCLSSHEYRRQRKPVNLPEQTEISNAVWRY